MDHKKMMNVFIVVKVVIGILHIKLRARDCPNRSSPRRKRYSDSRSKYYIIKLDIIDIEDLIHVLVLIHRIHHRDQGEEDIRKRDTVEVQGNRIKERKVRVEEDHHLIQSPDRQSAINRDSHISHHLLNEKGIKKKEKKLEN